MIIGINGKIGSGKDTIGSIIQYLTSECSNPNSSKHRSYQEFLNKGGGYAPRNFDHHYVSDWEVKKFAGKLKTIASLLTGIPVEKFEDQEFKKTNLGPEWARPFYDKYSNVHYETITVRKFLQLLGTESMRIGLHVNTWVNALFADYTPTDSNWNDSLLKHKKEDMFYPNWIITDMRFPNELEAIKQRDGITIRVVRPHGYINPHTGEYKEMPLSYHSSETALDDAEFDYEILNDGTIEDLIEKVREILIKENIV